MKTEIKSETKLDEDIKSKWIEALRSGKYKQGTDHLRFEDGTFCVLGVLCDVIDSTKWRTCGKYQQWYYPGEYRTSYRASYPPDTILEKIGLSYSDGTYLAELNDIGFSFQQIADIIERKFSSV